MTEFKEPLISQSPGARLADHQARYLVIRGADKAGHTCLLCEVVDPDGERIEP